MITKLQKKTNPPNKRRIASVDECKLDMKEELPMLFYAFKEAQEAFENEILQTPPLARARGFEASLLNSKMIQSIQEIFPKNWKFGKYKRFTLRIKGYTVLFKKFNNKGLPMNIKTNTVKAISEQLSFSLFDEGLSYEPILFFGYQKNKLGFIKNPKLIYIDEEQVKWNITEEMVTKTLQGKLISREETVALPKLKESARRKASGE